MPAVSVILSPDQYTPVYNPVGFTVSSSNYTQPNHSFIADIYINSAVTMTRRLKFNAYPSTSNGYVDVSGVLKNYLTSDPYNLTDTAFSKNANSILRYDIQFGEEYGASSGITTYPNITTSSGFCFNASLEHLNLGLQYSISDWVNWSSSNYTAAPIKFLTNSPRTINIKSTDGYSLYFLNANSAVVDSMLVNYYDSSGGFLGFNVISNSYSTVGTYDTRFLKVACGPSNLTLPANTASYTVRLQDATNTIKSETFTFKIDTTCTKAAHTYRFIFKNRQGAFDSFTFNGQYQRSTETKKDFYTSIGGSWVRGSYIYQVGDRAEKQFNTVGVDTFKCTSGWITEQESDWLADLIDSPEVYIYHPAINNNTPVNIVDTSYNYKTVGKDQLFNLEITFRPTFNKIRQQY